MADAAVQFLLENLKQVLLYNGGLIKNVKEEVEYLERELRLFRAFLQDSTKNLKKDEISREIVNQIREVVYDIEDAIDAYVTQAADNKAKNFIGNFFGVPKSQLISVASNVRSLGEKVKSILERLKQVDVEPGKNHPTSETGQLEQIKVPKVREENIVGFEDVTEALVGYLMEEKEELDVISIIGLPGLGKTTVAGKVFRDPKVKYDFPTCIWVNVSQEYNRKNVFLAILSKFIEITDHERQMPEKEIARIIREHLDKGKFLIVMDDVWTADAWKELKEAFPKAHGMGKILITSRNEEVASQANQKREPHKLRFLTFDESWELLQLEVFGNSNQCPKDLEMYGKHIAGKCQGLPLAIVVIGGILAKKYKPGDTMAMTKKWRKIPDKVSTYLKEDRNVDDVISWSYDKLPYYLRQCFLYMGIFPEDFEIPVWTLIRMWIAEGFILPRTDATLEETALDYLEELISRNLVMIEKVSTDGKIKTCCVHDTLRQFCKKKSASENFFQEMKISAEGGFEPPPSRLESYRRLCIHSSIMKFILSHPKGPRVRSFFCNSREEKIDLPAEYVSSIAAAFKLLRILDAKSVTFSKFPRDFTKLIHLRYVVLSSDFKVIPDAISELWNLQTLVVYTTSRTLDIKANIWKMAQLRHVKTDASAILPKTGKGKEGEKLQTLGRISPQSCTEDVFDRVHSLRKLGIRGLLGSILEAKGLDKLDKLEKLKLVNDLLTGPGSGGKLPRLPQTYKFPPNLRSLTLYATFLDWEHMSTLGKLDKLEVLKLKENAFMGERWKTNAGEFRSLEVLHIERTDLVIWEAEANHFPRLRCLVLRNCEKLLEVPKSLGEVLTFQRLDLKRVAKSAATSARRIGEAKRRLQEQESGASRRVKFKLYIAPGDE